MYYYLYDMFPKTGEERFEISTTPDKPCNRYWRDKSKNNLIKSKELLLDCWERRKVAKIDDTPQKQPFLCVTGQSEDGQTTYYQPYYQVRKVVEGLGLEFTA